MSEIKADLKEFRITVREIHIVEYLVYAESLEQVQNHEWRDLELLDTIEDYFDEMLEIDEQ